MQAGVIGIAVDCGSVHHQTDSDGKHKPGSADVSRGSVSPVPGISALTRRDVDSAGKSAGTKDFDPFRGQEKTVNALEVRRIVLVRDGNNVNVIFVGGEKLDVCPDTGVKLVYGRVA